MSSIQKTVGREAATSVNNFSRTSKVSFLTRLRLERLEPRCCSAAEWTSSRQDAARPLEVGGERPERRIKLRQTDVGRIGLSDIRKPFRSG
jgi:hypothetical protein